MKYFRAAAELGDAIGQFNYGVCCYRGEGICIGFVEAFEYFKESSNQNYPPGQLAVGFCRYFGRGIPCDKVFSRR
jgi:TPR repeat protein